MWLRLMSLLSTSHRRPDAVSRSLFSSRRPIAVNRRLSVLLRPAKKGSPAVKGAECGMCSRPGIVGAVNAAEAAALQLMAKDMVWVAGLSSGPGVIWLLPKQAGPTIPPSSAGSGVDADCGMYMPGIDSHEGAAESLPLEAKGMVTGPGVVWSLSKQAGTTILPSSLGRGADADCVMCTPGKDSLEALQLEAKGMVRVAGPCPGLGGVFPSITHPTCGCTSLAAVDRPAIMVSGRPVTSTSLSKWMFLQAIQGALGSALAFGV